MESSRVALMLPSGSVKSELSDEVEFREKQRSKTKSDATANGKQFDKRMKKISNNNISSSSDYWKSWRRKRNCSSSGANCRPITSTTRLMLITVCLLIIFTPTNLAQPNSNTKEKCRACHFMVATFKHRLQGMRETEGQHFGGGNTDWEEKKLGKFATSESRLVEILEHACHRDKITDDFEGKGITKETEHKCHALVEEHEEHIENWYFHKQISDPDFVQWLCIDRLKFCCAKGQFGPDCQLCPGDKGQTCTGRGKCDGDGIREGTGKCKCNTGYTGLLCRVCDSNFYAAEQNDTYIDCKECHESCKGGCAGSGPLGCRDCKSGWTMDRVFGCKDVNECEEGDPCDEEAFEVCTNTPGSVHCDCKEGYVKSDGKCQLDVAAPAYDATAGWTSAENLLRTASFGGLLLALILIMQQRSYVLATLFAVALSIIMFVEFGAGGRMLAAYFEELNRAPQPRFKRPIEL